MIGDRDFHHQQQARQICSFTIARATSKSVCKRFDQGNWGHPIALDTGDYQTDKVWYWNYHLPEETRRGLADQEDLYSPATW